MIVIVWRIREKIIRTVLCCIVYQVCTQYAQSGEPLPVGLGLVSFVCVFFCVFILTRATLFVIGLATLCFFFDSVVTWL